MTYNKTSKSLFIIDCDANISRCYKKSLDFTDEQQLKETDFTFGIPTFFLSAAIGNVHKQIKALRGHIGANYDYIALAIDPLLDTYYRQELSAKYKANRPEKTAEYLIQKKIFSDYMSSSGYTCITKPKHESDDTIGSLVKKVVDQKLPLNIFILTKDKDMYQLIDDKVSVFDGAKIYRRDDVYAKLGVYPEQVRDYLALTGDSVDGIEGVKGCGGVTAQTILSQFTMNQLIENPDLLDGLTFRTKKTVKKSLVESPEHALLQQKLTTLVTDIDLGIYSLKQLRQFYVEEPLDLKKFIEVNQEDYMNFYQALKKEC